MMVWNGKAENEHTKTEMLEAICEHYGFTYSLIPNELLDAIFGYGWRQGENYANKMGKIALTEQEKRIRGYYGDTKCGKCGEWYVQDEECGGCE